MLRTTAALAVALSIWLGSTSTQALEDKGKSADDNPNCGKRFVTIQAIGGAFEARTIIAVRKDDIVRVFQQVDLKSITGLTAWVVLKNLPGGGSGTHPISIPSYDWKMLVTCLN